MSKFKNHCDVCEARKISFSYFNQLWINCGCTADEKELIADIMTQLTADKETTDELLKLFHVHNTDISYLEQIEDREIMEIVDVLDKMNAVKPKSTPPPVPNACKHENAVKSYMPVSTDTFWYCRDCKQEIQRYETDLELEWGVDYE